MLVSHARRFIYLKTAKTAGTSVEVLLQPHCMPPNLSATHEAAASETSFGIVGARGPDVRGNRWRNHMTAAEVAAALPEDVWTGYSRICVIRNPWDKVVSMFHFLHPAMAGTGATESIPAFRSWLARADAVLGVDTAIYTLDGVPVIDQWLRFGHLEEDLDRLGRVLGIATGPLPRLKTGLRPGGIPWPDYYDDAGLDRVRAAFAPAIALFGWEPEAADPARLPAAGDRATGHRMKEGTR